jgi:hypothetical protein
VRHSGRASKALVNNIGPYYIYIYIYICESEVWPLSGARYGTRTEISEYGYQETRLLVSPSYVRDTKTRE